MPGYRAAAMVRTPWGDAKELRGRKLPPGRGTPPDEVAKSQRERLFGAMVAVGSEKGYEATRVGELALSGVSRKAFYEHFADKQECFLAAVEALVEAGTAIMLHGYNARKLGRTGTGRAGGLHPAARRPAGGGADVLRRDLRRGRAGDPAGRADLSDFEAVLQAALAEEPGRAGMPRGDSPGPGRRAAEGDPHAAAPRPGGRPGWDRAGVDAMGDELLPPTRAAAQGQAPRRTADGELRALADARSGRADHAGDGRGRRRARLRGDDAGRHRQPRLLLAVHFYSYFEDKEEAMLATLDRGGSLLLATVLPAFRRGGEWPQAVRTALVAMLSYAIEEPAFAELRGGRRLRGRAPGTAAARPGDGRDRCCSPRVRVEPAAARSPPRRSGARSTR